MPDQVPLFMYHHERKRKPFDVYMEKTLRWCPGNSPDAPAVRPVTAHPGRQQQGGPGLVKQEVVVDQLLLLIICHVLQGVILAIEVPIQ